MDRKVTVLILIFMFALVLFLVIDAKNKVNTINAKNREKAMVARVEEAQSEPEPVQSAERQRVNYTNAKTIPIENSGLTPLQSPEEGVGFEEIIPPENVQTTSGPRKLEELKVDSKPAGIEINELGVDKKIEEIAENFIAKDTKNNTYYFIPKSYGEKISEGTLGLLIKTSPNGNIEWQTEIYKIGNTQYEINGIKLAGDRLRISLSESSSEVQPLLLDKNGSIVYNPYQIRLASNFSKQPGTYMLRVLNTVSYKNNNYAVIAYVDKSKQVKPHYVKVEYNLYRAEGDQLVKKEHLFNSELLEVSTYIPKPIVIKNQNGIKISTYDTPKKEKELTIEDLEKPFRYQSTAAPNWIQPGISASYSNYVITITQ